MLNLSLVKSVLSMTVLDSRTPCLIFMLSELFYLIFSLSPVQKSDWISSGQLTKVNTPQVQL